MTLKQRFEAKFTPEPNSGCFLWIRSLFIGTGYGCFRLNDKVKGAHRVAWMLYRGIIPEGLDVCHRCDTRSCVNPNHLFLGTRQENMDDMVKKGRHFAPRGSSAGRSKISEADVLQILADDRTQGEVATDYNISRSAISLIKLRKRWMHVERKDAPAIS